MVKLLGFIAIIALMNFSCNAPKDQQAGEERWSEMEAFHNLMAAAYHPVHDSSNLKPAKDLADDLASAAASWAGATLPEQVNNDDVKLTLLSLRDSSAAFNASVMAGKPDSVLTKSLSNLHDIFHKLHGVWEKKGHEHSIK